MRGQEESRLICKGAEFFGLYTLLESVEEVNIQLFGLSDVVTDTGQKDHRNEPLSRRAFG